MFEINIQCYFCYETFQIQLDLYNGSNTEVWDCEICCNPNKVDYTFENDKLIMISVSSAND